MELALGWAKSRLALELTERSTLWDVRVGRRPAACRPRCARTTRASGVALAPPPPVRRPEDRSFVEIRARRYRRSRMRSGSVCPAPARGAQAGGPASRVSAIVTCSTMPSPTGSWAALDDRDERTPFSTNVLRCASPSKPRPPRISSRVVDTAEIRGQLGGPERDRAAEVEPSSSNRLRTPLINVGNWT